MEVLVRLGTAFALLECVARASATLHGQKSRGADSSTLKKAEKALKAAVKEAEDAASHVTWSLDSEGAAWPDADRAAVRKALLAYHNVLVTFAIATEEKARVAREDAERVRDRFTTV